MVGYYLVTEDVEKYKPIDGTILKEFYDINKKDLHDYVNYCTLIELIIAYFSGTDVESGYVPLQEISYEFEYATQKDKAYNMCVSALKKMLHRGKVKKTRKGKNTLYKLQRAGWWNLWYKIRLKGLKIPDRYIVVEEYLDIVAEYYGFRKGES